MFATAAHPAGFRNQASAYQQVNLSGVEGASPHKLVSMLLDGFVDAVGEARGAMRARNIETKGRAIGRAFRIVDEGLNAPLDLARGGQMAADLRRLYDYIALRLTHANLHNDEAALEECTRLIEPVRSAWSSMPQPAHA